MTTPEEYYELVKDMGPGQLFYLTHGKEKDEYLFDCVIVDTSKREETINRLTRAAQSKGFIGFPGTPEFNEFIDGEFADTENNK